MKTSVRADWQRVLLVCGKCSRKIGGGFGEDGRQSLAKLLRKHAGGGKGRKAAIGVVEVGCLKVCPRHAVVMIDAEHPRDWMLVAGGTSASAILERVGCRSTS